MNIYKTEKNFKKRITIALVVILMTVTLLGGCATYDNFIDAFGKSKEAEETIKIGIFEPMSGKDKEVAALEIEGVLLANERYPTVNGKKIELIYADNKSEIVAADTAAKDLIREGVSIVLGSYGSTLSMVGGDRFREAYIPVIAITPTNPLVTRGNPYYFRVSIVDSFQGVMAAKLVYNELGADRVAVIKAKDDDYGSALASEFIEKYDALVGEDGNKAMTIEHDEGATDFTKPLEVLKSEDIQVVYLLCPAEEAVEIVKQARAMGIMTVFLGTNLWHDEILLDENARATEGMLFTTYFNPEAIQNVRAGEFLLAYKEKYGVDQIPEEAVAFGYDAYILALDALGRQEGLAKGYGDTSLRGVLEETKQFEGATGTITFDENGDPIKTVMFIAVENREFIYRYTTEPEWK